MSTTKTKYKCECCDSSTWLAGYGDDTAFTFLYSKYEGDWFKVKTSEILEANRNDTVCYFVDTSPTIPYNDIKDSKFVCENPDVCMGSFTTVIEYEEEKHWTELDPWPERFKDGWDNMLPEHRKEFLSVSREQNYIQEYKNAVEFFPDRSYPKWEELTEEQKASIRKSVDEREPLCLDLD